jgi:probable rRNA maturation factor
VKDQRPAENRLLCQLDIQPAWPGDPAIVQAACDAALARDGLGPAGLAVLLVDTAESARLHAEHFDDPTPTDVMSFPDGEMDPETGLPRIGDLAVCVDVAAERAAGDPRRCHDELVLYVLHGLLHCLGYDDIDPDDRADMWAVQREILSPLGIAVEDGPAGP